MRQPDFIIIGAAKCGTTSLYKNLIRHPHIFMCTPKEPTFFAIDGLYNKRMGWYHDLFKEAGEYQICGEASTNYTNWPKYPDTATRIAKHLPNAKLIYMIRHSVDRAYSHYAQLIENERARNPDLKVNETFEEHIRHDRSVIDSSNYMLQIEQYLQFYPREAFLFLMLDDFKNFPEQTLQVTLEFLGLEYEPELLAADVVATNIKSEKDEWTLRSRLLAPFMAIPGAQFIADRMPKKVKNSIYSLMKKTPYRRRIEQEYISAPMLQETREELLEYFKGPNRKLAEFIGRDLTHWQQ